ncbi:MAG: acyltransferase [Muribaculaceae bacterium]|nr:acyltransferase [Muribaculaceae bacterium]
MKREEFSDICPYDDSEFQEKIAGLVKEPGFEHAVKYVMPDVDYQEFAKGLMTINSQEAFQINVMLPFLQMLVKKTTSGISASSFENIDNTQSYTFITNHRDIVLDASFLNMCLVENNFPTCEVAIGSNLLIFDWIKDLVKINKSFIVKRNLPMLQALKAAKQLSAYIYFAVNEKKQSVWIAQREGRAKDSNDRTQESLIKMMGLEGPGNLLENLLAKKLAPISISYEFDPNDYLKAREFLLRKNNPDFQKSERDDLFSMETGIMQFKGRVHFGAGKCINSQLEGLKDVEDRNEVIRRVCAIIDKSIHLGYKIYPINYVAYDELCGGQRFRTCYSDEELNAVNKYLDHQLSKIPDVTDEDYAYMRNMMLEMYANPLRNKLVAEGAE